MEGMSANRRWFAGRNVVYHPYVEPSPGAGRGLVESLAERASVVVTDDFPAFFLPSMVEAAGRRMGVKLEAVDSNGLLPMRAAPRAFARAVDFRRFLQRELPQHLTIWPEPDPFSPRGAGRLPPAAPLPRSVTARWPATELATAGDLVTILSRVPVDKSVGRGAIEGGFKAAQAALGEFLDRRLASYVGDRNQPGLEAASGLSPYLHFGHISAHEIFAQAADRESWSIDRLAPPGPGHRNGWWGMTESAEAFLDQLVTWRELGYNMCVHQPQYDRYESLPEWALETLTRHGRDPRPSRYALRGFEQAETHDPLWNAAQRQLLREGRVHNYLRMLWGKKILEWSRTPREALRIMIELNNKYALDGRNPNSYSGIFWVLGRYDRPWGPERPVFGTVRYMSSENTARKFDVKGYLEKYGP
jgi:deoxyribodipyrimidine photo-lyase